MFVFTWHFIIGVICTTAIKIQNYSTRKWPLISLTDPRSTIASPEGGCMFVLFLGCQIVFQSVILFNILISNVLMIQYSLYPLPAFWRRNYCFRFSHSNWMKWYFIIVSFAFLEWLMMPHISQVLICHPYIVFGEMSLPTFRLFSDWIACVIIVEFWELFIFPGASPLSVCQCLLPICSLSFHPHNETLVELSTFDFNEVQFINFVFY